MYLVIIAAVLAALLAFVFCVTDRTLKRILKAKRYTLEELREKHEPRSPDSFRAYDSWNKTEFTLDVGDAILSGEYIIHPQGRKKLMIFCHGHTVNRIASVKYAALFYKLGWSVLLYDHRYFGRSGGNYCTLGQKESDDLVKLTAFARAEFGIDCRIGFHGESLGAATALFSLDRVTPDFVIADCPFADTELLYKRLIPFRTKLPAWFLMPLLRFFGRLLYGYDLRYVSPLRSVKGSEVPICLIHGMQDKQITDLHSRLLFYASRNKKSELHLFPDARHAGSVLSDPERYESKAKNFIQKISEKGETGGRTPSCETT